jgi:hypothetical protein
MTRRVVMTVGDVYVSGWCRELYIGERESGSARPLAEGALYGLLHHRTRNEVTKDLWKRGGVEYKRGCKAQPALEMNPSEALEVQIPSQFQDEIQLPTSNQSVCSVVCVWCSFQVKSVVRNEA